jgi:hypothetical protein
VTEYWSHDAGTECVWHLFLMPHDPSLRHLYACCATWLFGDADWRDVLDLTSTFWRIQRSSLPGVLDLLHCVRGYQPKNGGGATILGQELNMESSLDSAIVMFGRSLRYLDALERI